MQVWNATEPNGRWSVDAARALREGGVVAVATDTFYGLAADCRSPQGIERVLAMKDRQLKNPLLLLVDDVKQIDIVANRGDERLEALASDIWPGPLTVVLPARGRLHPALVGSSGGVAVRLPDCPAPRRIARELGAPITGTSANRTGAPPALTVPSIDLPTASLAGAVDSGAAPGGAPSTLVDLTCVPARILREGAIPTHSVALSLDGRLV
ncbi:MAG: threonylcarbamoyl-AMP synthase [Acidobacteria bacterium]|nr:threonylcarbamoyl-AMP synthase [Acidobacteriota bacterium]